MISHFDRDALPSARSFFEREFGSALGRARENSKGYIATRCVFHNSENPRSRSLSLNLRNGNFICWSCGARGGDVIDFVMKRDGLDFKHAAMKLGAWNESPTPENLRQIEAKRIAREAENAKQAAKKERHRRERIRLRDEIHTDTKLMKKISTELRKDPDNEQLWASLQLASESRELTESEYDKLL